MSGVATQLLKEEPRAFLIHSCGHSLNLACSDAVKKTALMRNALDVILKIIKLTKKSPQRDALLQKLCPARWTVRADALCSIMGNYEALQSLWMESLRIVRVPR